MRTATLLVIAAIICATACNSKKDANQLISSYLKSKMDDPSSYESVSFSKLDTLWDYDFLTRNKKVLELDKWKKITWDSLYKATPLKIDEQLKTTTFVDSIYRLKLNDLIEKDNLKKQKGWYVEHSFRAKNKFGALILNKCRVELNITKDTILDIKPLK